MRISHNQVFQIHALFYFVHIYRVIHQTHTNTDFQNSNSPLCRPCANPFTFESNSALAINLALIAISVSAVTFAVATFIATAVAAARAKRSCTDPCCDRVPLLVHHSHSSAGRGRGMSAAAGAGALARGHSKSRRSATAADLRDMYDVIDEDYIAEKEHDPAQDASAPTVAAAPAAHSNDDSYDIFSGQRDAENLLKILFKPTSLNTEEESRYLTVTGTELEGRGEGADGGGGGRARLASLWPSSAKSRVDLSEAEMGMGSLDGRKASVRSPGSAGAAHNNLWSVRQLLREYEIRKSDPEVKRRRGSAFRSLRSSGGPQGILSRRDSEMPTWATSPPAPPKTTVARNHSKRRVAVSFRENSGEETTRYVHRDSRDSAPREDGLEDESRIK